VINKELFKIGGELVGANLYTQTTHMAAMMCPALSMYLRYGAAPPAPVDMVRFPSRHTPHCACWARHMHPNSHTASPVKRRANASPIVHAPTHRPGTGQSGTDQGASRCLRPPLGRRAAQGQLNASAAVA
jgi:hypothetical protein